jgi:hypothetical protein
MHTVSSLGVLRNPDLFQQAVTASKCGVRPGVMAVFLAEKVDIPWEFSLFARQPQSPLRLAEKAKNKVVQQLQRSLAGATAVGTAQHSQALISTTEVAVAQRTSVSGAQI